MFNRRLPGNVLLNAYYTPMTIRGLSIELGVASVYMEDEVALLEKYRLLLPLPGGKYQTNLLIFTEDYTEEFHRRALPLCAEKLGFVYQNVRERLPELRKIPFTGADFAENRLLWGLTYMLLQYGHMRFPESFEGDAEKDELYPGAAGINYGTDYDRDDGEFSSSSFGGYAGIDKAHAAAFADFGILPEKNRFNTSLVKAAVQDAENLPFVTVSTAQREEIFSCLSAAFAEMAELYALLHGLAAEIMRSHAPKSVAGQIDKVIRHTLFFQTVGLIVACTVKSGYLPLPDFDGPAALYIHRNG